MSYVVPYLSQKTSDMDIDFQKSISDGRKMTTRLTSCCIGGGHMKFSHLCCNFWYTHEVEPKGQCKTRQHYYDLQHHDCYRFKSN